MKAAPGYGAYGSTDHRPHGLLRDGSLRHGLLRKAVRPEATAPGVAASCIRRVCATERPNGVCEANGSTTSPNNRMKLPAPLGGARRSYAGPASCAMSNAAAHRRRSLSGCCAEIGSLEANGV